MRHVLYWREKEIFIETLPYKKAYDRWRVAIKDEDYQRITNLISAIADNSMQIDTIFLRPNEWLGSLYEPIYLACNENRKGTAMFFELIIFKVLLEREDKWQFSLQSNRRNYMDRFIYTKKIS